MSMMMMALMITMMTMMTMIMATIMMAMMMAMIMAIITTMITMMIAMRILFTFLQFLPQLACLCPSQVDRAQQESLGCPGADNYHDDFCMIYDDSLMLL